MVKYTHLKLGVIIITEKLNQQIRTYFSHHSIMFSLFKFCYTILPIVTAVSYFLLLITVLIYNDIFSEMFLKVLLVPAGVFLFVTLIRAWLNMPRPYERFHIKPLLPKSTKGHSFPSRHTASIFIIAMTFLYVKPVFGVIFLIFAVLIALSRFLCGVHFFRDIFAAALISIVSGIIFLFVI